jgi:hypothetical protein
VHLRRALDSESLEPFDLVRVVDADGDPELAGMALSGTLHRLPDGSDLAEPYVYHSRAAQALVLVVPPAARHREITARHALMSELEAMDSVPAYAFDFRVVVDPTALRTALAWHRPTLPPPLVESVTDDELDELAETGPELTPELLSHLATDVVDDAEAASLEEVEELDSEASVEDVDERSPRKSPRTPTRAPKSPRKSPRTPTTAPRAWNSPGTPTRAKSRTTTPPSSSTRTQSSTWTMTRRPRSSRSSTEPRGSSPWSMPTG